MRARIVVDLINQRIVITPVRQLALPPPKEQPIRRK